jgi:hypothetical protein
VIRLKGRIPHPAGYPETPRTLADHLKKARLDRGTCEIAWYGGPRALSAARRHAPRFLE